MLVRNGGQVDRQVPAECRHASGVSAWMTLDVDNPRQSMIMDEATRTAGWCLVDFCRADRPEAALCIKDFDTLLPAGKERL